MSFPFDLFDSSGIAHRTVRDGYAIWSESYDRMLTDFLDGPILAGFAPLLRGAGESVLDMGCGTGRTGAWARRALPEPRLTGVDLCPEMLAKAAARGIYEKLIEADMTSCGLPGDSFDLALNVLSACHVADLKALYAEASRALRPGGLFALIDYHPHMLLCGKGTCFPAEDGSLVAIENHVHLLKDHASSARDAGFDYLAFDESLVTREWLSSGLNKPEFLDHPIGFGFLWKKA